MNYFDWHRGFNEPNGNDVENCIMIWAKEGHKWADWRCLKREERKDVMPGLPESVRRVEGTPYQSRTVFILAVSWPIFRRKIATFVEMTNSANEKPPNTSVVA